MRNIILKKELIALLLLLLVAFSWSFLTQDNSENNIVDIKQTTCSAAEQGSTCNTKLEDLGFISQNECCQLFGKCCG